MINVAMIVETFQVGENCVEIKYKTTKSKEVVNNNNNE